MCKIAGGEKFSKIGWAWINFSLPKTVYNYYNIRDTLDSHNMRNQAPIALEYT